MHPAEYCEVVTPAASVSTVLLGLARDHLRIGRTDTSHDSRLSALLLPSAWQEVELRTGRQLLTATYRVVRPIFASVIELPKPPLLEVVSVTYLDDADDEQTVAAETYVVRAPQGPAARRGTVSLAAASSWPVPARRPDAVRVTFEAGYGATIDTVPPALVTAALLLVEAKFDEQPSEGLDRTVAALLAPFTNRAERAA